MRLFAAIAAIALVSAPALAQDAQPSQESIITALHQQVMSESDQLTVANARIMDDQKTIAELEAKKDMKSALPIPKTPPHVVPPK